MTLTVRLDDTLESALVRYCLSTGATKSRVVQEALAAHLLDRPEASAAVRARQSEISTHLHAFADAGLLGTVAIKASQLASDTSTPSATKAAVRARIAARLAGPAAEPVSLRKGLTSSVLASQTKMLRKAAR